MKIKRLSIMSRGALLVVLMLLNSISFQVFSQNFEKKLFYKSEVVNNLSNKTGIPILNTSLVALDFNKDDYQDVLISGLDSFILFKNNIGLNFSHIKIPYPFEKVIPVTSLKYLKIKGGSKIFVTFNDDFSTYIYSLDIDIKGDYKWSHLITQECKNCFANLSFYNHIDTTVDILLSYWELSNIPLNTYVLSKEDKVNTDIIHYKFIGNKLVKSNINVLSNVHSNYKASFQTLTFDVNNDNSVDIFQPADFNEPDKLLLNVNGAFEEDTFIFKSTSYFTMGCAYNDVNNDGQFDLLCLDMRPSTRERTKQLIYETPYNLKQLNNDLRIQKQQAKNSLNIKFDNSFFNISELAGLDATEWSWSVLIEDFDNDGLKDIYITNGIINDNVFHFDYPIYSSSENEEFGNHYNNKCFLNHYYKNIGNFNFKREVIKNDFPSISSSAIKVDIDKDGLLDIIEHVYPFDFYILKNNGIRLNNFIRFENDNSEAAIIKICIYSDTLFQCNYHATDKGLYSSSEDIVHFGLSKYELVDSAKIYWSDNTVSILRNLKANQIISTKNIDKKPFYLEQKPSNSNSLFLENEMINFSHIENDFEDFSIDPLLPNKYSRNGPGICIDDFDNDGKMDVLFGNAMNQSPAIYKLSKDSFILDQRLSVNSSDNIGVAYHTGQFIIPPGGYEKADGELKGMPISDKKFDEVNAIKTSSSCVAIADFNGDGKDEIFIGGRVNSHNYPKQPTSYLFAEIDGELKDITPSDLKHIGMVTSAIWTDFDNDEAIDLVIVGEYTRVEFFKNVNGKLKRYTDNIDFGQKMDGFWNSIVGADVNNDGFVDYIVGNLGMNTRYKPTQIAPLRMFANDFDNNGSVDVICTFDEDGKSYPMKQLIAYKARINGLAKKYNKVSDYANATFYDLFSPDKYKDMLQFSAHELRSGVLINKGNNKFEFQPLPIEAQFSPIYGIYSEDFNGDGLLDIATIGNFHHAEIERGPYTASNGWILLGKGDGQFQTLINSPSNFEVRGEGRALAPIEVNGKLILIATQNNDKAKTFELNGEYETETMPKYKKYAIIELKNGQKRKQEFYNGAGYLSNYRSVILRNSKVSKITFY